MKDVMEMIKAVKEMALLFHKANMSPALEWKSDYDPQRKKGSKVWLFACFIDVLMYSNCVICQVVK